MDSRLGVSIVVHVQMHTGRPVVLTFCQRGGRVGGFGCPQVWALASEVILRGGTVVAVVERGEFCWVLRTVLFLCFFVNFCGLCFFC